MAASPGRSPSRYFPIAIARTEALADLCYRLERLERKLAGDPADGSQAAS
jgi:hypothetical protein